MSNTSHSPSGAFGLLKEGAVIGPNSHRFLLVKKLGSTPYGEHWQATDQSAQNTPPVSLLTLEAAESLGQTALENLKQQIKKNQALKHKHIATTYGFFDDERHPPFITTEPLGKGTLGSLVKKGKHKSLSRLQCRGIAMQIASALDAAWTNQRQPHLHVQLSLAHLNRGEGVKCWGFGLSPLLSGHPQADASPSLRRDDLRALGFMIYQLAGGKSDPTHLIQHDNNGEVVAAQPKEMGNEQWAQLLRGVSGDPKMPAKSAVSWVQSIFKETADNDAHDSQLPESADTPAINEQPSQGDETTANISADKSHEQIQNNQEQPHRAFPKSLTYLMTFIAGIALGVGIMYAINDQRALVDGQDNNTTHATQSHALDDTSASSTSSVSDEQVNPLQAKQSSNASNDIVSAEEHIAENTELDDTLRPTLTEAIPADERHAHFKDRIGGELFAPVMVAIPAGSFVMGDGHKQGDDNEQPQRTVHIRPFAISATEITFEDYAIYAEQAQKPLPDDAQWGQGKRPVINVSWQDAYGYARWLSLQTGQPYRLPTEAEWEYAARATSQYPYPWGRKIESGQAVCDDCGSQWDGKSSAEVASQMPNRWGLYDMSGNVNEWVQDCYQPSIPAIVTTGSALEEANCAFKVVKGGSWFDIGRLVRPAGRYRHPIGMKTNDLGFRIAVDLPH
ncbi:MAG: SUMF1/EgtB/PvdO family nonheme iron enzyme [Pontibacterium sp.]